MPLQGHLQQKQLRYDNIEVLVFINANRYIYHYSFHPGVFQGIDFHGEREVY
jgi:hypothetical protein